MSQGYLYLIYLSYRIHSTHICSKVLKSALIVGQIIFYLMIDTFRSVATVFQCKYASTKIQETKNQAHKSDIENPCSELRLGEVHRHNNLQVFR